MKGQRRQGRIDALQILYQLDLNEGLSLPSAIEYFSKFYTKEARPVDPFAEKLVHGVTENLTSVDEILKKVSENWRLERMAAVDRNILRIGAFELKFCDDIPTTVTINEMIEIAKEFGSDTSPSFINGILDKIRILENNPNKAP